MLAPIITKDMKLFPTRPLPARVRNVRSRAQTLDDLKHSGARARSRVTTIKPQPQSMDHLPLATSRSPPRCRSASFKKPPTTTVLSAIVEGVEMRPESAIRHTYRRSLLDDGTVSVGSSCSLPSTTADDDNNDNDDDMQLPTTAVTTSACSLLKDSLTPPVAAGDKITADKQTATIALSATRSIAKFFNSLQSKPKDDNSARNGKVRRLSASSQS